MIMCDEVIEKTIPPNFNEKKATCKMQNFCILLAFLLIAISNYCYLIKYWAKQKHLLPFHETNNDSKQKHSLPFHDTNNGLKPKGMELQEKETQKD